MYAAWVLILQLGAYAAIFELGLQAAISKFVAQHHATQDHAGTSSVVSTATALLTASAALALTAVGILVWQVPHLFGQLTPPLVHQVRLGILLIGGATALALPTTALASSFQGVQRYNVPMIIGGGSQLLSTLAIIIAVFYHSSLIVMGACVAAITLAAGLVQVGAWRRYLAHIRITVSGVTRRMTRTIFNYCAAMSVLSFAMLLISGLDTVIVGHFDFKQTGFYAVAASLTNFVILTAGAVFNPLLPAASELAALGDRAAVASLTLRSSRFCAVLLVLTGLPLLLYGYPIFSLWVGADYARNSILFLEILTIANMLRLCVLPYFHHRARKRSAARWICRCNRRGVVNLIASIALASKLWSHRRGRGNVHRRRSLGRVASVLHHEIHACCDSRSPCRFRVARSGSPFSLRGSPFCPSSSSLGKCGGLWISAASAGLLAHRYFALDRRPDRFRSDNIRRGVTKLAPETKSASVVFANIGVAVQFFGKAIQILEKSSFRR